MLKFKGILVSLALLLPVMLSFVSCSEENGDIIWDIAPVVVPVDFQDAAGNSLLQPGVDGCIVGEPMEIVYKDDTYPAIWGENEESGNTRMYLAVFDGITFTEQSEWNGEKWVPNGKYLMEIGELAGDETYDETLVLKFRGKEYPVRVRNEIRWKKNTPSISRAVYFNGAEVKDFPLVISVE